MAPRGHVRLPSALLYAPLPDGAVRLWALLDDLCREWAAVRLTVPAAARTLHCAPRSVSTWRRALVESGWLHFEPAAGRGQASLWVPLHRARPVLHRDVVPVDNSTGRVQGRVQDAAPSDQGKGAASCTLDGGATRARTQEQKPGGRVILPLTVEQDPAAPCPLCMGSRWVDSLVDPDRVERCPQCVPGALPAF